MLYYVFKGLGLMVEFTGLPEVHVHQSPVPDVGPDVANGFAETAGKFGAEFAHSVRMLDAEAMAATLQESRRWHWN